MVNPRYLVYIDEWANTAAVAPLEATTKRDISNAFKNCVTFVGDYESKSEADEVANAVNQSLRWVTGRTANGDGVFIPIYDGKDMPDLQDVQTFRHFIEAFRSTI